MRWNPRRNGGNNTRTRAAQSRESRIRDGHGAFGFAGHHSYPKSRGGGNKTGAITHAPKEWGSQNRKEEEHLTGLAKQAELDAIDEGLIEIVDFDPAEDAYLRFQNRLDELDNEFRSQDAAPLGVMLNGQPISYDEYDYFDEFYLEREED